MAKLVITEMEVNIFRIEWKPGPVHDDRAAAHDIGLPFDLRNRRHDLRSPRVDISRTRVDRFGAPGRSLLRMHLCSGEPDQRRD